MIAIGNYLGRKNRSGTSFWSTYWSTLISATVENAAPTNVVLTFPTAQPSLDETDFTIYGFTISSASWAGAVLTLVLSTAVIYGDTLVVTFEKTDGTANITNNVSAEGEFTTYITGLGTPLSDEWGKVLNAFIKELKTELSIANLSDFFDILYVTGGETSESALKNLVENAHHATLGGTPNPTFTAFVGMQGDGANGYLDLNYNPSSEAVNYLLNNASVGIFSNSNVSSDTQIDIGNADGTNAFFLNTRSAGGSPALGTRLNNAYANTWYVAVADSLGLHIITRNGNADANLFCYKNKASLTLNGSPAGNTTAIANADIFALSINIEGTPTYFSTRQLSLIFAGEFVSTANRDKIFDAFFDCKNFAAIQGNIAGGSKYASNPIITGTGPAFFNLGTKIGNTYYGYAQKADLLALKLYTTTDLLTWTYQSEVLSVGVGEWDDHYLHHPTIIKVGTEWWMYYAAKNAAEKIQVGLAKSSDLVTWVKYGSSPVYSATGNASAPSVIKIGSTYYMYYSAFESELDSNLCYATSPDGLTWTYQGIILSIQAGDWEYGTYTALVDPWVNLRSNGVYEMMYTAWYGLLGVAYQVLGYAVSIDGIHWGKYNGVAVDVVPATWESLSLFDPVLIEMPNKTRRVYYGGTTDWIDGGMGIFTIP